MFSALQSTSGPVTDVVKQCPNPCIIGDAILPQTGTNGAPDSKCDKKKTKKQTPHFRTYSRRSLYDLPQILHGDRARRDHHKRCHPFFDPTYSFSYRVHGKIWPNLPTRGFSAITP